MGKEWPYAQITRDIAVRGGPDKWLELIKNSAYAKGASDMKNALVLPVLIVGLSLGAAGTIGVRKIREWIAEKKQTQLITEQEAAEAEEYLKGELTDAIETLEPVTDGDTTSSTSRCTTMGTEKNDP